AGNRHCAGDSSATSTGRVDVYAVGLPNCEAESIEVTNASRAGIDRQVAEREVHLFEKRGGHNLSLTRVEGSTHGWAGAITSAAGREAKSECSNEDRNVWGAHVEFRGLGRATTSSEREIRHSPEARIGEGAQVRRPDSAIASRFPRHSRISI